MTVSDFIAALSKLPGDIPVQIELHSEMDGGAYYSDPEIAEAEARCEVVAGHVMFDHYVGQGGETKRIVVIR